MISIQKRISIPSIHNKIKMLLVAALLTSLFSTNANALTGIQQHVRSTSLLKCKCCWY